MEALGQMGSWSSQLLEAALDTLACGPFSACLEPSVMGRVHLWSSLDWLPLSHFSDCPLLPASSTFKDRVVLWDRPDNPGWSPHA